MSDALFVFQDAQSRSPADTSVMVELGNFYFRVADYEVCARVCGCSARH